MSVEETAVEAVKAGAVEVPADLYVGTNVDRQHVAEFFYRAQSRRLLGSDETPLAIFDCIILERDGRRLGGLTLHDYAIITDKNLVTWGRGLNKDIVDAFPWKDITLEKFGRRNVLEGVIKFTYGAVPTGGKRKINLRTRETQVTEPETTSTATGTALYLDLMPARDVRTCVQMIHYFVSGGATDVTGFKAKFRDTILESQERVGTASFLTRPFYVDMGNGMLVEAGSLAERPRLANKARLSPADRTQPASPYRREATPRPAPIRPAREQSATPAARISAPENDAGKADFSMSGNVPVIDSGNVLNVGNRATDTMSGRTYNNDTMRGGNKSGGRPSTSGRETDKQLPLGETVSLDTSPYRGPSKLDQSTGARTSNRSDTQSRLVRQTPSSEVPAARPAPAARPEPAPRPAPATNVTRVGMRSGATNVPAATYASPPQLPLAKQRATAEENVLDESADKVANELGRPLVVPIALAIPRLLLNPYSISRLARGLWVDPRNVVRNVTDVSQTVDALSEMVEIVSTDAEARSEVVRRLKIKANTTFGNNTIFHYTVWPFIKPVIDAIQIDSSPSNPTTRQKVAVRRVEDEIEATEQALEKQGGDPLPNMGKQVATDAPAPVSVPVKVAKAEPKVEPAPEQLNTPSKGATDPTAGLNLDAPTTSNDAAGKSKLGDL